MAEVCKHCHRLAATSAKTGGHGLAVCWRGSEFGRSICDAARDRWQTARIAELERRLYLLRADLAHSDRIQWIKGEVAAAIDAVATADGVPLASREALAGVLAACIAALDTAQKNFDLCARMEVELAAARATIEAVRQACEPVEVEADSRALRKWLEDTNATLATIAALLPLKEEK